MRYLLILSLASCSLFAQAGSISIGAKLGAPVNEPTLYSSFVNSYQQGRWTGGPTIEIGLPFRFSVEVDALYRNARSSYSYVYPLGGTNPYNLSVGNKTNAWDFPLLLKYHFHAGPLRPFISGGVQYSRTTIDTLATYTCLGPAGSCAQTGSPNFAPLGGQFSATRHDFGPVAGAGVEFKTQYLTISPELRYSRPTNSPRDNRFTALVGFTFGARK
jgi:hypothetical protein